MDTPETKPDEQKHQFRIRLYNSNYLDVYVWAKDKNEACNLVDLAEDQIEAAEWAFNANEPEVYDTYQVPEGEEATKTTVGELVLPGN